MHENKKKAEEVNKPLYEPKQNELQYTFRAILTGCLIGAMVTAMNIYIGLKIGWSFGGSLIAAIIGYGFFTAIKPKKPFTVMEVNITQTAGSGAGTMASASGFLAAIPAIQLSGYELSGWQLMTWCIGVAFLGVMFAVPLRRQYIEQEQLRFPTGLATANTIMAMFASAGESLKKARALLYVALFGFVFAILSHYFPFLSKIPLDEWTGSELLGTLAGWGFLIYFSPVMLGAGLLIGPRIGTSLVTGAVIGWATGYVVQQIGWAPHENPMIIHENSSGLWGPRGWILWPGVAIMVSEALVSLGLSWKTFFRAFKGSNIPVHQNNTTKDKNMIPNSWWIGGLIACSVITTLVSWYTFHIPWYFTLLAILLSLFLANVAVRAVGETDINPIGGMGKITQGVFGLMSNVVPVNLMAQQPLPVPELLRQLI